VKLHAPIPRPAKNVFCVGWNYLEHFDEGAQKLQDHRELPKHRGVVATNSLLSEGLQNLWADAMAVKK